MKNRTVHNRTKKQGCLLDQEWEILSLSYFLPQETFLKVLKKQYKNVTGKQNQIEGKVQKVQTMKA